LALVHALALCKQRNIPLPIYTDSMTALAWIRNKKAKTTLKEEPANEKLFDYIDRAEKWLKNNTWNNKILKWDTENWGEIPADFGRK
ncbi:MAG: ribonuclease H, partial [Bacteroidales bacterium]